MNISALIIAMFLLLPSSLCAGGQRPAVIKALQAIPEEFSAATGLTVQPVLMEPEADYRFSYRWFVNGEELLFEHGASLSGDLFRRGDEIAVEVTPIDAEGEALRPLFGLPLVAANSSPSIESVPPTSFGEDGFSYQVRAVDLDDDILNYRLEGAAAGMMIDNETGLMTWGFKIMPEGFFTPVIVVGDGHGGQAEQELEFNLSYGTEIQ